MGRIWSVTISTRLAFVQRVLSYHVERLRGTRKRRWPIGG